MFPTFYLKLSLDSTSFVPSFIFHRLISVFFSHASLPSQLYSKTGFVCAMFYRRNAHVTELQMGTPATRLEDACTINHFDINRLPFITLLGKGESKRFLFHCSEIDFSRPFPFSLLCSFFIPRSSFKSRHWELPTHRLVQRTRSHQSAEQFLRCAPQTKSQFKASSFTWSSHG